MDKIKAVVLAAGKGSRMYSERDGIPKVMRPVCGRPMISYVLRALNFIPPEDTVLVVGYHKEKVIDTLGPSYVYAEQARQMGTGHAVQCAEPALAGYEGHVLICCGDMPLIRRDTYRALIETHTRDGNVCTLLSGFSRQNLPYGRILRDEQGRFLRVAEEADCTPGERAVKELNASVYVMEAGPLFSALALVGADNAQAERYLTDVPAILAAQGGKIGVCRCGHDEEILGVNTPEQLEHVEYCVREGGLVY